MQTTYFGEKNEKTNKNCPIIGGNFFSIPVIRLRKQYRRTNIGE